MARLWPAMPDGRPNFTRLHVRWTRPGTIHLWAFDLLAFNGRDLRLLPLVKRQAVLQTLLERFACPAVSLSEPYEDARWRQPRGGRPTGNGGDYLNGSNERGAGAGFGGQRPPLAHRGCSTPNELHQERMSAEEIPKRRPSPEPLCDDEDDLAAVWAANSTSADKGSPKST